MRSSDVSSGDLGRIGQYNKLRDDAYGSSWLLAHEQDTPGLTLKVENGTCYINGVRIDFAGGNSPSFTAPATNPRIDILSINLSGTLVRTAGTENASPTAPEIPADNLVIAQIYNRVGQTSIKDTDDTTNGYVYKDVRPFLDIQSKTYLKFIAEMDLTAGNPVGLSADKDSVVAKAVYPAITTGNAIGSGIFRPDSLVWLNDDLFICVFISNAGTNGFSVVAGTIDRDTMQISFGSDVSVTVGEGYESAKAVKVTTNTFSIYYVDDGTNELKIKTYSVSGTAITVQNTTSTGLGGGIIRVNALHLDTNKVVFFNGSYGGGNVRRVGYVTYSGYVPSVIATDSTFGTASAWSYGAKMTKVDTDKIVIVSCNVSSSSYRAMCFTVSGGVIAFGSEYTISVSASADLAMLNIDIVSYATNRVLVRLNQLTSITVFFGVLSISGTTCSLLNTLLSDGSGGSATSTSGKMIFQTSTGKVIEYQNDTTPSNSGIYQITPSDGSIIRKLITNGINLTPENNVVNIANNTTNDYYVIIVGVNQLYGKMFIRGLSTTFLGFAQSTVNRGDEVYVRRDGDNHQSGLIAGGNYKVSNGGLVESIAVTDIHCMTAKSSTEVLR